MEYDNSESNVYYCVYVFPFFSIVRYEYAKYSEKEFSLTRFPYFSFILHQRYKMVLRGTFLITLMPLIISIIQMRLWVLHVLVIKFWIKYLKVLLVWNDSRSNLTSKRSANKVIRYLRELSLGWTTGEAVRCSFALFMSQRLLIHFIAVRRVCFAGKGRPFCSCRKTRLFIITWVRCTYLGSLITRATLPFSRHCTDKGTSTCIHNEKHASCKSNAIVKPQLIIARELNYLEHACKSN